MVSPAATEIGRAELSKTNLTDARIGALLPRRIPYELRDGKLQAFGVRVMPSGRKRFFLHCQHKGERVWKIVGEFDAIDVNEARSRAAGMLAAIRRGEAAPARPEETLFEAVAETVFRQYERLWKPGTLDVNRCYLRNQILPHFAGRPIAEIDCPDVRKWFAALRATPVAADRSMPVLSVIMREAEAMGLRPEGSNPCRGIRRYRRKGRERFLADDELRRLSACLAAHAGEWPLQVAVIRLLLLTGCRKGEILTLRWSDYREGHLFLRDSKTGPRTVWLSGPGPSSTGWSGRDSGCFLSPGETAPIAPVGCMPPGGRSVPKPGWGTCAFTTSATRMRASRSGRARPCSPSAGCSDTAVRRPPSSTSIPPMP